MTPDRIWEEFKFGIRVRWLLIDKHGKELLSRLKLKKEW
jgi:hypothetical protein